MHRLYVCTNLPKNGTEDTYVTPVAKLEKLDGIALT